MASTQYLINTDVKFGPLELVDVKALADACKEQWFNQTLVRVNDSVVRVGILHGEFHWHKHDTEDEFFYLISGRFLIDLEGRTVELRPGQGLMVPHGVMHCTRAPERSVVMMIEAATVKPTGD
ncbi:MAG TPA: cupin domain-containing protein [Vicinamibacterales bacterium]|nr:cupin domain-containing protein [Vicinamibacterales bacterium]